MEDDHTLNDLIKSYIDTFEIRYYDATFHQGLGDIQFQVRIRAPPGSKTMRYENRMGEHDCHEDCLCDGLWDDLETRWYTKDEAEKCIREYVNEYGTHYRDMMRTQVMEHKKLKEEELINFLTRPLKNTNNFEPFIPDDEH